MMTKWKDAYPRPQLVRDKWLSLDGEWTISIKKTNEAGLPPGPRKINVPFCPESMLSGLNRITRPDELLLYGRSFKVPEEWNGMRLILHLGAVDQTAKVYIDGKYAGSHEGGYLPFSLQYEDYTAKDARAVSIAGGDPMEKTTNRSFKGKTVKAYNRDDMVLIAETKKAMGDKPVIVILETGRPVVLSEIEPNADAILVSFQVQHQALLDIISGKAEPSALLPMQMPADMKTVEEQQEDVPRDMRCYQDGDGNTYDFAFGLNWKGVINDARVEKYK